MATFDFEGKQVYYEDHGAGKPILILNGIMMSTASWEMFKEPLTAQNRLILLDFLDQGQSARMTEAYDQGLQVEVVKALLTHLGLDKASLAGISYGSEVALGVAVKYPQIVDNLLLFNATAATGAWLRDIGEGWNACAGNAEAFYNVTIPVVYAPSFYKKHAEWMDNRRKLLLPVFGAPVFYEAMTRLTNSSAHYDVRDKLAGISAPTLVVSGQQDHLIPLEEQQYLAAHIPNAQHVILPDCGHGSMYEKPILYASLILGFVNLTKKEYAL